MKIPDHAKRVFKGIIFDVYQWEQEMFDGSKETFEMLKRPGTVTVIPLIGDRVILAREQQPLTKERYTLLGGRQEDGENPLESAKRELLEESGLVSDDWQQIRMYQPVGKMDWQIYVFVARDCQKAGEQKLDAGERIKIEEFSFDGFVECVISPEFWEREISNDVYRLKCEDKLDEFKRLLFGDKQVTSWIEQNRK